MINIKYAINNLIRKPIRSLLIIIQIVVSLILLYIMICLKNEIMYTVDMANKFIMDKDQIFVIKDLSSDDLINISAEELENFNKYLASSTKFQHIPALKEVCYVKTFEGEERFKQNFMTTTQNNTKFVPVFRMSVGEAFLTNFNIKVKEGRAFNKNDYVKSDDKTIPVILGNGYLDTYNLGSEIESLDEFGNIFKLKVIGFLKTGSIFCDVYSGNNIQALDNYIIYPQIKPNVNDIDMSVDGNDMKYKIILYNDIFNSYIKINKSELRNTSEIENEMKKLKSNIKLESIETGLNKYKDMIKETKSQAQVIFIIVFIFASVGFVSSILYSITHRLREFGVHLMQGATLNGIASMIFYEIAFVMLTSYIITLELINLLFGSDKIYKLNSGTAIEMFIFVAAICILLSAVPIWKVLNLQIGELVKGDE